MQEIGEGMSQEAYVMPADAPPALDHQFSTRSSASMPALNICSASIPTVR